MSFTFHSGPGSVQPETPDTSKLIDKGAFFDRFGAAKMPVLLSQDSTIKAVLADISNRNWIDLSLADVTSTVDYIATVIPELTPEIKEAVLNQQVEPMENLGLRKLYFS